MASFTDNPQLLTNFNPYVQQLPIDAMREVGMYKQAKYDEGVQKIQTSIDNIAGMDVANDVDKGYLQSKLSELGNNLKTVAAGDFSNFQLVNSTAGMANAIAKDKTVQNAVMSTARLRKEQSRKEQAIKDGKSSPDNEYVFNKQVSEYLSSTEAGSSFDGQYVEYKDVDKKLRGLASDLQKAGFEQTIQDPYVRDSSGKDIYFNPDGTKSYDASKGGTRKYDMVKLVTKIKGVGADKILNNFYSGLDEGDKRQLNITAQYHYRNSTSATFQKDIIDTYAEKKKIYSEAIIDANVELASGKLTKEQKTILENEINKAKKLVYEGGFDKQMNEELAAVDTEAEVDTYKYNIYTQKYLTNLAKDLANESKSIEYESNPGWNALMDKKKFEFDVQKERQREREWQAKYILDVKEDKRKDEEAARKRKEDVDLQPIVKTEKISTDIPSYGIQELDADIDNVNTNLTQSTNKLARLLVPNAKTPQEKADAIASANKLYEKYRLNPTTIKDNRQRQLLEQIDQLDNEKYTLTSKLDAAQRASAPFKSVSEKVINQQKGVKIGNTYFSAKELYDFENQSYGYVKGNNKDAKDNPLLYLSSAYGREKVMTQDILRRFKGTKQYPIALALYNNYNGNKLSSNEKVIVDQINKIKSNTRKDISEISRKQREVESKTILDLSPEFQQMNIQLNPGNKRDMNVVEQIIGLKTKDYNDLGALDSKRPDDFSPAKIAEMKKAGNLGYTYIKKKDGSATLVFTSGKDVQKIPLSAEEFRNWVNDYSYVNPMSDVIYSVQSSRNKTTNKAGTAQGSTARYTGYSPLLPGFNNTKLAPKVRVDIEGSPDNIGNASTDVFQARLYYYDGKGWKDEVLNSGGYVDAANLQILLSQTGQKTIETLFK
jgi:hypothetical protein